MGYRYSVSETLYTTISARGAKDGGWQRVQRAYALLMARRLQTRYKRGAAASPRAPTLWQCFQPAGDA